MSEKCRECGEVIPINHTQVGGVHMTCESAYQEKKIRMIKLRPSDQHSYAIMTPLEAGGMIQDMSVDEDGYEVKAIMMSKIEIDNLKDFEGW